MRRQEVSGKIITNFCFSLAQNNNSMHQIWKHLMVQRIASNHALFRPETPLTAQIIFGPSPLWSASLRDESLFEYSRSSNLHVSKKKLKSPEQESLDLRPIVYTTAPMADFAATTLIIRGGREREKRPFFPSSPIPYPFRR